MPVRWLVVPLTSGRPRTRWRTKPINLVAWRATESRTICRSRFRCCPGDTIEVIASSTDSTTYPGLLVDGEGKVHVPIAGAIQVSGLSPQLAERKIEEALQKFDRFVRVSVLVTAQGGHYATVLARSRRRARCRCRRAWWRS